MGRDVKNNILDYWGELWGFQTEDRILCRDCYNKLTGDERKEEIRFALGTEDRDGDDPDGKKFLYICDECGKFSK